MNGTGSLRSHPSPAASDGVRKEKRKLFHTHRKKIAEAMAKKWASLSPEARQARIDKSIMVQKRHVQLRRIKSGRMSSSFIRSNVAIDEDFDEMGS